MESEDVNEKLAHFIDSEFVYRFTQNPDVVRDEKDARRYGINCVSLAHLAIRELFNVKLPSNLLCAELYADRDYFDHIEPFDELKEGDLVWFGIEHPTLSPETFVPCYVDGVLINWREFPIKHVAVSLGERDKSDEELLLHSSYQERTNAIWPLSRFTRYKRYQRTYGLSRLKVD